MAGVDVDTHDGSGQSQLHHAVIVSLVALAARFPAVHPLAVVIVLARNEHRRLGIEHPFLGCEKIVGGEDRLGPQPGIRQVD
jgi:hypothetical protein